MKHLLVSIVILALGLVGFLNPLRNIFQRLFVPVQFGLTRTASNISYTFGFFSRVNDVRNQNIELLEKIRQMDDEIARLKVMGDENALLRAQMQIAHGPEYNLKLVELMGNPADVSDSTYIVNAGSRDGVRIGDSAVVGNNIVGTIKSVEYSKSILELITSPNISLTAFDIDSKDKAQGLIVGKHNSILSFERILPNDEVKPGDLILTAGKEGVFLPNQVIGKVIDVQSDPSQPLKKASVRTILDFTKLSKVFILISE